MTATRRHEPLDLSKLPPSWLEPFNRGREKGRESAENDLRKADNQLAADRQAGAAREINNGAEHG